MPVRVDPHTLDFVGPERPAATHGLSACDAAYLKLALHRSLVLVSRDALLIAAPRAPGRPAWNSASDLRN